MWFDPFHLRQWLCIFILRVPLQGIVKGSLACDEGACLYRCSMCGLMHQLDTYPSQQIIHQSGRSGGSLQMMWSLCSLWEKIMCLSTL
jgi:hypothetical protein